MPESWPGPGTAGSDTLDVTFDAVRAIPVGEAGAYLERPGFHHRGIGVAACWHGGARAVARTLLAAARSWDLDPHALAHLGAADARLVTVDALLDSAAAAVDADPHDRDGTAHLRTMRVRAAVEDAAGDVLGRVGRALDAAPLGHDAVHARAVADLTVYLRQHHAERDLGRPRQGRCRHPPGLGGRVTSRPAPLSAPEPRPLPTPADPIQAPGTHNLLAERIVISSYQEIARWLGDHDPTTRRLIESILEEEEQHADDLTDLLAI